MDPSGIMPVEPVIINTTVPVEVIYYQADGFDGNDSLILGEAFKSDTEIVDLTFTVTRKCQSSNKWLYQLKSSSKINIK